MIRRDRRWKSPSIVSSPSPRSGIRSPRCPSRQRKFSAPDTRMKWLAAGPSMNTIFWWKTRNVKIGPNRA
jgi:hypothetical protein